MRMTKEFYGLLMLLEARLPDTPYTAASFEFEVLHDGKRIIRIEPSSFAENFSPDDSEWIDEWKSGGETFRSYEIRAYGMNFRTSFGESAFKEWEERWAEDEEDV